MKTEEIQKALSPKLKEIGISNETMAKEISFAVQHVNKNPKLKQADGTSVMQSIMNVCQVGLSLNPVKKLGYLVPRWDAMTKKNIVAFEPSYQGLVKLLTDSGSVEIVYAQLVYENDHFEVLQGTTQEIIHKPQPFGDRGNVIGVYAVGVLPSGIKMTETMSIGEIEEIRERSDSYKAFKAGKINSCVWDSDFGEMARKTVIRRIFKYLPKSENFKQLAQAISYDEEDYTATPEQLNYIDMLLENSTIRVEKKFQIETEMDTYSQSQAAECIAYLKDNQLRPIDRGNMSARELSDLIDEKINDPKS